MNSSFHLLTGPLGTQARVYFLGQNMLLSGVPGAPLYAAIVYAVRDLRTDAPAAALLIKRTFSRPMMPGISPGGRLWDDLVQPHIPAMKETLSQQAGLARGIRLGGVAERMAMFIQRQPDGFHGGGVLLVPGLGSPGPVAAHGTATGAPLPVATRPPFIVPPRLRRPLTWVLPKLPRRAA
ncbi:MAG: hypothetical protein ACO1TE_09610 [Prosthecobacter sp.]